MLLAVDGSRPPRWCVIQPFPPTPATPSTSFNSPRTWPCLRPELPPGCRYAALATWWEGARPEPAQGLGAGAGLIDAADLAMEVHYAV